MDSTILQPTLDVDKKWGVTIERMATYTDGELGFVRIETADGIEGWSVPFFFRSSSVLLPFFFRSSFVLLPTNKTDLHFSCFPFATYLMPFSS
jgi:hypothetical protein